MPNKKVFVSGCYDLLHSGHVEFFMQASRFGDLYVGIGSDATYLEYKHRKPMFPEEFQLLKDHLCRFFNTKVQLSCNEKGKGRITIPFSSEEELEKLIGLLDTLK